VPVDIEFPQQDGASVNAYAVTSAQGFLIAQGRRDRKYLGIYNDSATANLLVLYGDKGVTAATSTTNGKFSFRVQPKQFYEAPAPAYQGAITAIFETQASGDVVRVTEAF
jgi:hypothetical protein